MSPWVLPSTGTGRQPEGLVLDPGSITGAPIDLGTTTGVLRLSTLTLPPAQKIPQWAMNGDSDGQQLVRTPFYSNRDSCQMQVRVNATDPDVAMAALGTLQAKLQDADRLAQDGGLPVLWTPTGASTGLTMYWLLAQITDMPITIDDGWFAHKPVVTVAFTAKPFLYGEETSVAAVSSSSPIVTITVPNVPGDVAAEARLVLTDTATETRRFVEWGLEQHYYNSGSPSSLLIDSASLVTTGYAGTALATSGALGGTVINAGLFSQPVAVCAIGAQPHIGTYRVKARVLGDSLNQYWRLAWQQGDGPIRSNDYTTPAVSGNFSEIDLGTVSIEPAMEGSQQWFGRIEAYTTTAGGENGAIDDLILYPAGEGYGRIASTYGYQPGVIIAHDEFTSLAAGTALNGRVTTGGTWTMAGSAPDFVGASYFTQPTVSRSHISDTGYTYAVLGSTALTDIEVGASVWIEGLSATESLLVARWVNATTHLRLRLGVTFDIYTRIAAINLVLEELIGGSHMVATTGATHFVSHASDTRYDLRLIAYSSGRALGWWLDSTGNVISKVGSQVSADLQSGGALQSGKVGIGDINVAAIASTRFYDNFYAAIPAPEPVAIHSTRSLEVRSNSNQRQSSDGTAYGDIVSRGSRLFIPPAGDANRTTRIIARATRNDLLTTADTSVAEADSLQAQVFYTPRYLAVPR